MRWLPVAAALVLLAAGCGSKKEATPKDDPRKVAVAVMGLITANHYAQA